MHVPLNRPIVVVAGLLAALVLGCGDSQPLSSTESEFHPTPSAKVVTSAPVAATVEARWRDRREAMHPHVASDSSTWDRVTSEPVAGVAELAPPPARPQLLATLTNADRLPVGIEVVHTPAAIEASLAPEGWADQYFYWFHQTVLRPVDGDVTITEFAGLGLDEDGNWVQPDEPFTATQFADWYDCPDATLSAPEGCADFANWGRWDVLSPWALKWVYVGVDETGRAVKGEAVVNMLGAVSARPGMAPEIYLALLKPTVDGDDKVSIDGIVLPAGGGAPIAGVEWDWGDGTSSDSLFPAEHSYAVPGSYSVTATATNAEGQFRSVTIDVFVNVGG